MISVRPAGHLAGQMILQQNLNAVIFLDTVNMISAWWYYSLSFTHSYYFQCPWVQNLKVTGVWNGFNWNPIEFKLCWIVKPIKMIMNVSPFFLNFLHAFKGDNWHISSSGFLKKVCFFSDTTEVRSFNHCMIITLLWVCLFIVGLMTLTLFQGHRLIVVCSSLNFV